ncbi:E3 ubiquitin-protein ligase UPL1-like [Cicer arietinum]|uniref:E3 ubiquitin-protein ligase UPL1-like n=1 Tax=Cicer arietinum TaxID=3827 RepID=A0A3Q7X029_CICAR|nr:E3 ubiquitin-protein ligase UPL1-like [Cicer arietinum]
MMDQFLFDLLQPPKIRFFINSVTAVPLEEIQEPLKPFTWEFDKGDFHHWVDLFNHFGSFFEKYVKPRKDLQIDDNFLDSDPPFPTEAVLQILRVIRIVLDNCSNKHFYSSYEDEKQTRTEDENRNTKTVTNNEEEDGDQQ